MQDALRITASAVDPGLLGLPWSVPLAKWPSEHIVSLPKGLSRHLVRFACCKRDEVLDEACDRLSRLSR